MAGKRKAAATTSSRSTASTGAGATGGKKTLILRRTKKVRPATWKTRLWGLVKWSAVTGLVLVLIGAIAFVIAYKKTDIPDPNKDFDTQTSFVYYDGGKDELGQFSVQNRTSLTFDKMPQNIKDAVVAAENKSFWTDSGISPTGIVRAAFSNARGNSTQGGSTITQQYVKILYLNQERSYQRKIKEALLSLKIQREESKEEVLTGYLNDIYFGRGAYGIQAAAQAYFKVDAADLSLKQAAVLACVLNNPTGFDPANGRDNKRALHERYDYVLDAMVGLADVGDGHTQGITQEQADRAERRLPKVADVSHDDTYGGQKGFMLTMVKDALLDLKDTDGNKFTEDRIDGGGLRVTTTFSQKAMQAAEDGVKSGRPEGFGDKQLHVGVASVEPGTGAVRGFYAGQDYLQSQLNWAIAGGQAGSTFKPFALAAGLKAGYSLRDTFDGNDGFDIGGGKLISNEADTSYGSVNLITAVTESINTAFVDLTTSIPDGPEKVIETANAMGIPPREAPKKADERFGFPDHTPGLDPYPTVTLGSQTVSPINMANAYATIANAGVESDPYIIDKVTDADGNVLYQHEVVNHRAISSDIAADVSYTLQQNVQVGTGAGALALDRPAAGKTGTATNDQDQVSSAWFAGYTPQLATAVMYVRGDGNDQLDGWLPSFYGADYPTTTWTDVMRADMDGLEAKTFPPPVYVDGTPPETGHTYVAPPPPPATSRPTRKPTRNPPSSTPPTSTPPTVTPPTSQPPTSAPPTSTPPTQPCGLLGCPSSSPPPTSAPPSSPAPGPSGGAPSRSPGPGGP